MHKGSSKREREPQFPSFSDTQYVLQAGDDGDLGKGRTSRVKRATHAVSGAQVAVKIFKPDAGEARKYYVEHARGELAVMRKLEHHPGIVALVENRLFTDQFGDLHMIMEHATWDWASFIRSRHSHIVALGQLKGWMKQAAEAVTYCHQRHVVHRDIKPENLLITNLNQIKLCDFGLASIDMWHREKHTEEVTTRWYRAPEVFVCKGIYDEKIDVWSLAMTFVELLTRKTFLAGIHDKDQLRLTYLTFGTPKVHEWPSKLAKLIRDSYEVEVKRNEVAARLMRHAQDQGRLHYMAPDARAFLEPMLELNPEKRCIISQVLKSEYLTTNEPLPYAPSLMVRFDNKK